VRVKYVLLCDVLNRRSGRSLRNKYGAGEGVIWLDDVECVGTETDLANCRHLGWKEHNCGHHEDVSISCGIGIFLLFGVAATVLK